VLDAEFASYIVNDHADNRDLNRELRKLSTNAMWLDLASSLSWSEDASAAVRELLSMSSLQTVQDQIWKLSTLSEISTRDLRLRLIESRLLKANLLTVMKNGLQLV